MKAFLAKSWPSLVHLGALAILFLEPSVKNFVGSHPGYAAPVGALWGIALHWATSPKSNSGSQF